MFLIFNFKRINMSIDLIKNYTSNIEQEMFDKKRILDAYDKYGKELFYRENEMMHFTSSSMIINKNKDKVLMVYHWHLQSNQGLYQHHHQSNFVAHLESLSVNQQFPQHYGHLYRA